MQEHQEQVIHQVQQDLQEQMVLQDKQDLQVQVLLQVLMVHQELMVQVV